MVDGGARRARWPAWLALLVMLVAACERSLEPGGDRPSRPPATTAAEATPAGLRVQEYPVPAGSRPHDVAPAADGRSVWYTAQGSGQLGLLDPATGKSRLIPLGDGSAPHGVIVGPDGAPWITDGGLNAIVRVDPRAGKADRYPLPPGRGSANLNTAAFRGGVLWFTGQAGVLGRLDPKAGRVTFCDYAEGWRRLSCIALRPETAPRASCAYTCTRCSAFSRSAASARAWCSRLSAPPPECWRLPPCGCRTPSLPQCSRLRSGTE